VASGISKPLGQLLLLAAICSVRGACLLAFNLLTERTACGSLS
jgi:hypothetical protein